jgi:hypothetical protein
VNNLGLPEEILTMRFDPEGQFLWSSRYNGSTNNGVRPVGIIMDGGNNTLITASTGWGLSRPDLITVKYDPEGKQLWTATYNGVAGKADEAVSIKVDGADNIYVLGTSVTPESLSQFVLLKYAPDGRLVRETRYSLLEAPSLDAVSLHVSEDGTAWVLASNALVKYSRDQQLLWARRLFGGSSLAVDSRGRAYVAGFSGTRSYDADGNELWADYNFEGCSLALDGLGGIYVSGNRVLKYEGFPDSNGFIPRPRFISIGTQTNNQLAITFQSTPAHRYTLEYSTNLHRWFAERNIVSTSSESTLLLARTSSSAVFYRLRE